MKYIIPLTIISLLLLGCVQQNTIFSQIEEETELEEAVITGTVNSIVKFGDKLYTCDGNIYSKNIASIRDWSKSSSPGGFISKLAIDASNIYALSGTDRTSRKLYASTDGSTWTEVPLSTTISSIDTIFCNGMDTAYLHGIKKGESSKSYFKISPSSAEPTTEVSSIVVLKTDKGTYTAKDGTVTSTVGGQRSDLGTIYSLTYSKVDSAIYAGTSRGLRKLPVDSTGKLAGENQNPPGNWGSTIKSHEAFAIIATGENTENSALYSSVINRGSANVKVNGLWGYYYNRRGTWNRE